jgi:hypothetical protein
MRDINPEAAANRQGTVRFKYPFLHLLILSVVFHTFLKLITSNKKYTHKNVSVYPFCRFEENPLVFMKLIWSFFILSIFQSKFHFIDLFLSNSSCCEWRPCVIKFGAYCTFHRISLDVVWVSLS